MNRSKGAVPQGWRGASPVVRGLLAVGAAGLALWLLASCSNPWKEGKPDPRLGENCYRVSTRSPKTRVTNFVDPELCGRVVAHRSPYHVRTRPQPGLVETVLDEEGR